MLPGCRMISADQRNKNLKDILIHTAFNMKQIELGRCFENRTLVLSISRTFLTPSRAWEYICGRP